MLELQKLYSLMVPSLWETIYMVVFSTVFACISGFALGVVLIVTEKDNIMPMPRLNSVIGFAVNTARSLPFIILIIAIFPLSRLIVGTSIGSTAAIVPLSIAAAPFVARVVESSLKEVDKGVVEAAMACGATRLQIIGKVLLPEALPSLMLGVTITIINILGYSAMAGAIGGGGIGDLAIRYGYQRFETDVLVATIIVLIVMVQAIQAGGNMLSARFDKR